MPLSAHPDHGKISFTAKLVAYYRMFSDVPFARDVADYIGAEEAHDSLFQQQGKERDELMEYAPILEARYKSIVNLISKQGIRQVLELASGFSLRGLAMTQDPDITYVDTDLEDLNAVKIKLIAGLRAKYAIADTGNYHIATANALDLAQLQSACRQFRRDQPIAIVNEGLIIYFSVAEREQLARNIHALLDDFGGVWITPDFSTKTDPKDQTPGRRRFRQAVTGLTERTCMSAAFDTDARMDKFFAEFGFQAELHYQMDEAPNLASMEALALSPQIIERERAELKIWVLRAI
jgi:O-methyltransferase involved in polyketide biosynthesis